MLLLQKAVGLKTSLTGPSQNESFISIFALRSICGLIELEY
jgi:hypothetical protein